MEKKSCRQTRTRVVYAAGFTIPDLHFRFSVVYVIRETIRASKNVKDKHFHGSN